MTTMSTPDRRWGILGVPSSRAAHWPGLERGPAALRAAGLVAALEELGLDVTDHGDLPEARWRSAPSTGGPHDVEGVLDVLRDAEAAITDVLAEGLTPLVLGGECTLALSLVAAAARVHGDIGLVYIDGGQDLQLPADHPEEPILDSMGVAHMLDLPGALADLAGRGPRRPLLTPEAVCFLGYGDNEEDVHGLVPSLRLTADDATADPAGSAAQAVAAVTAGQDAPPRFVVHVDVDVLDALLLPGPDIPQYGRGLTLDTLVALLTALVAAPGFSGLTLVEYNPDHDPDGASAARIVDGLAQAIR
ncbi:arginase family protein [Cellulomonas chengniuliangii]|uniref:Arginase family protein n=1 Tax=Cellulomonas chengniuliangii TaxID=2968084 RepID=A0ABY5L079_9CELL|nr:arginase family protein [Cellulomonas chengniuliangii]MCC2307958.1 arginase family protein [Cellulomonas chengniuliangii]UUI75294.1 arginase family protein [Cellulomonas chengniuliangii]